MADKELDLLDGLTTAAGLLHASSLLGLSDSVGEVTAHIRLRVGAWLSSRSGEAEELVAGDRHCIPHQRAGELVRMWKAYGRLRGGAEFIERAGWSASLECLRLSAAELRSLVSGRTVRGVSGKRIGEMSRRQLRSAFAEGDPRAADLERKLGRERSEKARLAELLRLQQGKASKLNGHGSENLARLREHLTLRLDGILADCKRFAKALDADEADEASAIVDAAKATSSATFQSLKRAIQYRSLAAANGKRGKPGRLAQ